MRYTWPILVLILLAACENSKDELERIKAPREAGIEMARDVELLYSDSAIVRMKLNAPLMYYYVDIEKPKREFPEGVEMVFFNEYQQPNSYMSAKYAIRYDNENKAIFRDSVVVWNQKNEKMECEELTWDERSEQVTTKRFVRITKQDEIIEGYDLVSNLDFTRWQLNRVTGIVKTKSLMNDSPLNTN